LDGSNGSIRNDVFIPVGEPWSPYASCHTYIQIHTATVELYVPKQKIDGSAVSAAKPEISEEPSENPSEPEVNICTYPKPITTAPYALMTGITLLVPIMHKKSSKPYCGVPALTAQCIAA
jgi:hypothetical protein